jgi:hypothetical protein
MTTSQESNNGNNNEWRNRKIDLGTNNPWLQDSKTPADLDRESTEIADHYLENHLRAAPNGQSSNTIKRELNAFYGVDPEKESTLVRYTLRKMAGSPKTDSAITDFTKSDEYYISYRRD